MSDFNILMDIVDQNDQIIGQDQAESIHRQHFLHRAIHILLVNSQNQIFLRQRSFAKELYPGVWSTSVGEHVKSGEAYDVTAHRALKEFLGLELELRFLGNIHVEDAVENELVSVYIGKANAVALVNLEHMEKGEFLHIDSITQLIKTNKVTPHLADGLRLYQRTIIEK